MPTPRVLILRAPGTNCDGETAYAFDRAGGQSQRLHVNRLLENPRRLGEFQILCLPGGFSYGDDLAAGRIQGSQMQRRLGDALARFKADGKLILGICNGFQVLMRCGLLLDDSEHGPRATLAQNQSGRLEDRWVRLKTTSDKSPFLSGIAAMYLPVAHGEGNFIARDEATLVELERTGRIVLRYATADGRTDVVPFPENPNGAQGNIAGLCDATGRVLGLMPHPERHIDRTHHPRWTRGEASDPGDGLAMFKNAVAYFL